MDRRTPAMTMERFAELLDSYGAAAERWPARERDVALALLRDSAEARRRREEAARLDALLDRSATPPPPADLLDRVVAAATALPQSAAAARSAGARARSAVAPPQSTGAPASPAADAGSRRATYDRTAAVRPGRARRRWRAVAVAASVAAAAVTLWLARPVERSRGTTSATAIAALESYGTPTDALLDTEDLDFADDVPALGCSTGDWGCPDLAGPQKSSTTDLGRRVWT